MSWKTHWTGCKRVETLCATVAAVTLLSACEKTTVSGNAGCLAYGEARLAMPPYDTVPVGAWGLWVADTDDRMTGACR